MVFSPGFWSESDSDQPDSLLAFLTVFLCATDDSDVLFGFLADDFLGSIVGFGEGSSSPDSDQPDSGSFLDFLAFFDFGADFGALGFSSSDSDQPDSGFVGFFDFSGFDSLSGFEARSGF